MTKSSSSLILTLALLAAGCSDGTAPPVETTGVQLQLTSNPDPVQHVLRQDPLAPPLETYDVSFWAIVGTNRSVEVRYQNGKPNGGVGDRFLRFTVSGDALETGLDGKRLRQRDSVLISLHIDASTFQIEFEPSGLNFARKTPATLEVWYGNADPDANRDGVVDALDANIFTAALGVYHFATGSSKWDKVDSSNDVTYKTISATVGGFSGYAVSW